MTGQSQTPTNGKDAGKLALQGLNTAAYLKAESQLPEEHKATLATHLAAALNAPGDDPNDVAEAESILRVIIWNNEGSVLESIAQAAASNPNMTNTLAWALANDDEAVAKPILEESKALSDTELTSIVETTGSFLKMGAIAGRASVSADLSRSLALHGNEDTAHRLLNNANADIPEDALTCILDRHEGHQHILEDMVGRETLTSALAERLMDKVSPALADGLRARGFVSGAPTDTGPRIDRNIMGYRDEKNAEELDAQVAQMIAQNEITAPLLVRKLCDGYFEFFVSTLASTAKLPKDDVRQQLIQAPSKILPTLWKSASLPADWMPVASAAVAAFVFAHKNYNKSDIPLFRRNISDRALSSLRAEKRKLTDEQVRIFHTM